MAGIFSIIHYMNCLLSSNIYKTLQQWWWNSSTWKEKHAMDWKTSSIKASFKQELTNWENILFINFKRKIWTSTKIRTWISRSLAWRSAIQLSWFLFQFTFKLSSWNVCHFYKAVWSMTLPPIYWSLSELTSLLNKHDALNQITKCLNQIISENKPYNLRF